MEHFLFIILFQILCDDRNLWTFLGTKLTFFIFLVLFIALFSIITLVLDSGVHGYFVLHTKIFGKRNFCTLNKIGSITILLGSLKIRNIFSEFSQKSIEKNMNMSFLNVMICYYFPLETVLLSWLKINLPKNKSM